MTIHIGLCRNPVAPLGSGGSASTFAPAMPASIVFDLDATIAESSPGTGTNIYNIEATPADGSDQSDYDFVYIGVGGGANGPVFTGTPGDPAAYLDYDNSTDAIAIPGADATGQPAFLKNFHKANSGQVRSVWMAFRKSTRANLLGTQSNMAKHGFTLDYNSGLSEIRLRIANGGSGLTFPPFKVHLETGKDYLLGLEISSDGSTSTAKIYLNSPFPYVVSAAWAGTTDADGKLTLGNDDSANNAAASRFYWAGAFEGALSAEDILQIAAVLQSRHQRAYIDPALFSETDPLQALTGIGLSAHISPVFPQGWDPATQKLLNVVAAPASGNKADSDFYLGPTSSQTNGQQPRFVGGIGARGAYLYWDDGDESITQVAAAGVLAGAHRSDRSGFWFSILFKTSASFAGLRTIMANGTTPGIRVTAESTEEVRLQVGGASGTASVNNIVGPLAVDTTYLLIGTWNGTATSNNVEFWLYDSTGLVENGLASATFNASTADHSGSWVLLCNAANSNAMQEGTRFYDFAAGNVRLNDTQAADIAAALESLHGVDLSA